MVAGRLWHILRESMRAVCARCWIIGLCARFGCCKLHGTISRVEHTAHSIPDTTLRAWCGIYSSIQLQEARQHDGV